MNFKEILKGIIFLLAVSSKSFAVGVEDLFEETVYVCTVTSFTLNQSDIDVSFKWSSLDPRSSHGGLERTFQNGSDELVVIGNDAWMGVAWWRSGQKIGEAVSLVSHRTQDSRVLILLNPKNDEERVHMDCTKPTDR